MRNNSLNTSAYRFTLPEPHGQPYLSAVLIAIGFKTNIQIDSNQKRLVLIEKKWTNPGTPLPLRFVIEKKTVKLFVISNQKLIELI